MDQEFQTPDRAKMIDAVRARLLAILDSPDCPLLLRTGFLENEQLEKSKKHRPGKSAPVSAKLVVVNRALGWALTAWEALHEILVIRDRPLEEAPSVAYDVPAERFVFSTACLVLMGKAHTFIKFHCSYLFAVAASQTELPPLPKGWVEFNAAAGVEKPRPGVLSSGWVYRRCHMLMRKLPAGTPAWTERLRLAQDLLYLKIGCPVVTEDLIQRAIDDHRTSLTDATRHQAPDPAVEEEEDRLRCHVKVFIRQICAEVFKGWEVDEVNLMPSPNASYELARQYGGASGLIGLSETCDAGRLGTWLRSGLPDVTQPDRIRIYDCSRDTTVLPVPFSCLGADDSNSVFESRAEGYRLAYQLVDAFQDWIDYCVTGDQGIVSVQGSLFRWAAPLSARPFPIPEPLKVRMITMGPALAYYRGLALQQTWWKKLRRYGCFRYVGETITDNNWDLYWSQWGYGPGTQFVSGDYEASTDNLHPDLSRYCISEIFRHYRSRDLKRARERGSRSAILGILLEREDLEILATRSTLGHLLRLDSRDCMGDPVMQDRDPEGYPAGLQQWGQLMGSPCSFPILNIINLAAYCAAMALSHAREVLGKPSGHPNRRCPRYPVLTNGDDIAFAYYFPTQLARWRRYVTASGLKPSAGKNYVSPYFCQMNSELRLMPLHRLVGGPDPEAFDRGLMTLRQGRQVYPAGWGQDGIRPRVTLANELDRRPVNWGELSRCERDDMIVEDLYSLFGNVPATREFCYQGEHVHHCPYMPFINLSLLRGVERKGQQAGTDMRPFFTYQDLGPRAEALVYGFEEGEVRDRVLNSFIHRHKDILIRCPAGVSWYAPTHLGGAGLPCPRGVAIKKGSRVVAAYLASLPEDQRSLCQIDFRMPGTDVNRDAMSLGRRFLGLPNPERVLVRRGDVGHGFTTLATRPSCVVGLVGLILNSLSRGLGDPSVDPHFEQECVGRLIACRNGVKAARERWLSIQKRVYELGKPLWGWEKEVLSGTRLFLQHATGQAHRYGGEPMSQERLTRLGGLAYVEQETFDESKVFPKRHRFAGRMSRPGAIQDGSLRYADDESHADMYPLTDAFTALRLAQPKQGLRISEPDEVKVPSRAALDYAKHHPSGLVIPPMFMGLVGDCVPGGATRGAGYAEVDAELAQMLQEVAAE